MVHRTRPGHGGAVSLRLAMGQVRGNRVEVLRPAFFGRHDILVVVTKGFEVRPKVFGIGFHKTGTTSLSHALQHLGYRVTGPNEITNPRIGPDLLAITTRLSKKYDAFQDNPWPLVFREMDAMWPDAKFVLTWRTDEKWLSSAFKHFQTRETPMREVIYGKDRAHMADNEDHYLAVYRAHNQAVRDYFADRPGKLLEMNLEQGSGWAELCPFLGTKVPEMPFPHANSVQERTNPLVQFKRSIAKRLRSLG